MPNHVEAEKAARAAIARAEELGYRVQIDDFGVGQWNVFLRQGPDQPNPTSIVTLRKFITKSDIASAIDEMLRTPEVKSINAYLAELER